MNHLPPRSARLSGAVRRPRPGDRRGRRHPACRAAAMVEAMEARVLLAASGSILDDAFGIHGVSRFDVLGLGDNAQQVLALPDGRIVLAIASIEYIEGAGPTTIDPEAFEAQ